MRERVWGLTPLEWLALTALMLTYAGLLHQRTRIVEMCDLLIVLPQDEPVEAYPNRQAFPSWCGPDPLGGGDGGIHRS